MPSSASGCEPPNLGKQQATLSPQLFIWPTGADDSLVRLTEQGETMNQLRPTPMFTHAYFSRERLHRFCGRPLFHE